MQLKFLHLVFTRQTKGKRVFITPLKKIKEGGGWTIHYFSFMVLPAKKNKIDQLIITFGNFIEKQETHAIHQKHLPK